MILWRKITLFLSFLLFAGTSILEAAYSNPMIRVLLFKTSSPVILQSLTPFTTEQGREGKKKLKRIEVRSYSNQNIIYNRKIIQKHLLLSNQGSTLVKKKEKSGFLRYWGEIEIHPFTGGIYVINVLPIENYLEGVLNAEISTKWDMDVVKAQAIIARTFALFKRNERKNKLWHVTSGSGDQVYLGMNVADLRGRFAIRKTHGMTVYHQGKLAQTFYHSNCGGITEDPAAIWSSSMSYLKVKNVPYGQEDPRYYWSQKLSERELLRIARRSGQQIYSLNDLKIASWTTSNRAAKLKFFGDSTVTLLAKDFRRLAGYKKIQSLLFTVAQVPGGYLFEGQGNGHGVGLCQWAAKEMADLGYSYKKILHYFYTNIRIQSYQG